MVRDELMPAAAAEFLAVQRTPMDWKMLYGKESKIKSPKDYFQWFTRPLTPGADSWPFAAELEANALALLTGYKVVVYCAPSIEGKPYTPPPPPSCCFGCQRP